MKVGEPNPKRFLSCSDLPAIRNRLQIIDLTQATPSESFTSCYAFRLVTREFQCEIRKLLLQHEIQEFRDLSDGIKQEFLQRRDVIIERVFDRLKCEVNTNIKSIFDLNYFEGRNFDLATLEALNSEEELARENQTSRDESSNNYDNNSGVVDDCDTDTEKKKRSNINNNNKKIVKSGSKRGTERRQVNHQPVKGGVASSSIGEENRGEIRFLPIGDGSHPYLKPIKYDYNFSNPNRFTASIFCNLCKFSIDVRELPIHVMHHLVDSEDALGKMCIHCAKDFSNAQQLQHHYVSIGYKCNSTCSICLKHLPNLGKFVDHILTSHADVEMPYLDQCGFMGSTKRSLQQHHDSAHGSEAFCPYCDECFYLHEWAQWGNVFMDEEESARNLNTWIDYIALHLQTHLIDRFECNKCDKVFVRQELLNYHMFSAHVPFGERTELKEWEIKSEDGNLEKPFKLLQQKVIHSVSKHSTSKCDEKDYFASLRWQFEEQKTRLALPAPRSRDSYCQYSKVLQLMSKGKFGSVLTKTREAKKERERLWEKFSAQSIQPLYSLAKRWRQMMIENEPDPRQQVEKEKALEREMTRIGHPVVTIQLVLPESLFEQHAKRISSELPRELKLDLMSFNAYRFDMVPMVHIASLRLKCMHCHQVVNSLLHWDFYHLFQVNMNGTFLRSTTCSQASFYLEQVNEYWQSESSRISNRLLVDVDADRLRENEITPEMVERSKKEDPEYDHLAEIQEIRQEFVPVGDPAPFYVNLCLECGRYFLEFKYLAIHMSRYPKHCGYHRCLVYTFRLEDDEVRKQVDRHLKELKRLRRQLLNANGIQPGPSRDASRSAPQRS